MNGLYNGVTGDSHRARIPSRNNIIVGNAATNKTEESYSLIVDNGTHYNQQFSLKKKTSVHLKYVWIVDSHKHILLHI